MLELVDFDTVKPKTDIKAPLFPGYDEKGTCNYTLTKNVYIERSDFSESKVEGFFGVMPGNVVLLKYACFVQLVEVSARDADGKVMAAKVKIVPDYDKKIQGVIHWVSKENSLQCRVNNYQLLLTEVNPLAKAEEEGKDFTEYLNNESVAQFATARIWNNLSGTKHFDRFQFERVGYYCCDIDSRPGSLVFNSIVSLKESAAKKKVGK